MASPGRILIVVENLPVPMDRRVWMEANTLVEAGYEVSVICPTGKHCEALHEVLQNIHIYRHPLPPEHSSAAGYLREYSAALRHQWRLARHVYRERGFDVIHACNPPDLVFLIGTWFKWRYGTRFIFDHHDLAPELYESKFGKRGIFHRLLRFAERLTYRTADHVIATNESYREVALTRGKHTPDTVTIVRSGPDMTRFRPTERKQHYRGDSRFLVGYLGVMGEFDGVDHLVRAAAELIVTRKRRDIQFMFIGDGPTRPSLQALAVSLGIADRVEFTGRVPDDEMIERLASCDVGVDPDPLNPLNDKSTMNKILEYMALGLPVAQYDLLEGRRSAGEASLYARPNDTISLADKIEELLNDPAARKRMSRIGRERMAETLEWKHQAPKLREVYDRVFASITS